MASSEPANQAPVERMRDHWWWRPGWRSGRRFYTWHLTFDAQAGLHDLARTYQAGLHDPGLDMVPLPWLHLTMQGVGFVDEVSQEDLHAIEEASRQACERLAAFAVTFGPAAVNPEGVLLRVSPVEPIHRLRLTLREAMAQVWGPDRVSESATEFTPHVTLAYSNAARPAAPLVERVQRIGARQATTRIETAQLILLERDTHVYRWKTRATVHLGAEVPPAPNRRS